MILSAGNDRELGSDRGPGCVVEPGGESGPVPACRSRGAANRTGSSGLRAPGSQGGSGAGSHGVRGLLESPVLSLSPSHQTLNQLRLGQNSPGLDQRHVTSCGGAAGSRARSQRSRCRLGRQLL